MQSLEHFYAKVALDEIQKQKNSPTADAYGQMCYQFPALVLTNGLRLTITYYHAKDEKVFLNGLKKALKLEGAWPWQDQKNNNFSDSDYRLLTQQALSASKWFSRYAEAILKTDAYEVIGE